MPTKKVKIASCDENRSLYVSRAYAGQDASHKKESHLSKCRFSNLYKRKSSHFGHIIKHDSMQRDLLKSMIDQVRKNKTKKAMK